MNLVLYSLLPALLTTSGSFTSILADATEVFTWFITSMGSLITFILANPLILMMSRASPCHPLRRFSSTAAARGSRPAECPPG